MNAKSLVKTVAVVVALVCISAGNVQADELALQEKLSKEIKIQLNNVTIAEALEKIGQKAGVKFVLSDEAAWKLPNGEATRLSVALDGPLADSMTEMLNAFFMRYAVGEEEITIYPRVELEHILGRPTAKQLELLMRIYKLTITVKQQINSKKITNEALGQEVLILPVRHYSDLDAFLRTLTAGVPDGNASPPFTLAQMLDSVGGAWYLSGTGFPNQVPAIRLVTSTDFRNAKLDQIVDISFKDEKAETIIQRLAKWTGMELFVEKRDPLWLNEKISVDMQNIKLGQALRNIVSTEDGLISIDVRKNAIHVYQLVYEKKPSVGAPKSGEGYAGKISIPMDGGKYYIEFMLREGDLTDELKKLRAEKMKEVLGQSPKAVAEPKK